MEICLFYLDTKNIIFIKYISGIIILILFTIQKYIFYFKKLIKYYLF